jgi:hypothetical protein
MTFLPEDDIEFLDAKGWSYELKTEDLPGGAKRNAVLFPAFEFDGDLYASAGSQLTKVTQTDLLILIPQGYSTTQLDSWYTRPRLVRSTGENPVQTAHTQTLFGVDWQFWSRHLNAQDWRGGVDGLETFMQHVRTGLRQA